MGEAVTKRGRKLLFVVPAAAATLVGFVGVASGQGTTSAVPPRASISPAASPAGIEMAAAAEVTTTRAPTTRAPTTTRRGTTTRPADTTTTTTTTTTAPLAVAPAPGTAGTSSTTVPPTSGDVTTTKKKVHRVVFALGIIGGLTAVLTVLFAFHTNPRRRVRLAEQREAQRSARLAAAAAVSGVIDVRDPPIERPADADGTSAESGGDDAPVDG